MTAPDNEPLHRHMVVLATDRYDDDSWDDLPDLGDEVDSLTDWLCSPGLGDRRFQQRLRELARSPTRSEVIEALCDPGQEWTDTHAVFLFVTGHGEVDGPTHYLVLRRTESGKLRRTAVKTADLVGWLSETGVDHLFLVLDVCYAGQVAEDVIRTLRNLPPTWVVLPSATSDEQAVTGALTTAISEFLSDLASDTGARFGFPGRYLTVDEFRTHVQERLAPGQTVLPLYGSWSGKHPCLPNPHVRDSTTVVTESIRRELALPKAEVETHWGPRSRGVRLNRENGWLFTGRARLMRKLIEAATGEPGITVVRGGAGTGKSAVLARLVTLSDPAFREEYRDAVARVPLDLLPPLSAVDIAVLAAGKLHSEVLSQLVAATGNSGRGDVQELLDRWHAWLSTRDKPVTVVVDALDESANPDSLAREVLVKLRPPGQEALVRLLVGVRTTHGKDSRGQGTSIRILEDAAKNIVSVDEEPWWEPKDLRDYARSVLVNSADSPYQDLDADHREEVTSVIATKAGRSFLVAGIHAGSLAARRGVVRADDPEWQRTLDAGVSGVLRDDLFTTLPDADDRERAVSLLRALAFSCGRGLPWRHVWPAVTTAIDGERSYGDLDITWLLGSRLNGYLVTDEEDGVLVYRLFHDQLRGILKTDWRAVLESA